MQNIIALKGRHNSGKTTTLHHVKTLLKKEGFTETSIKETGSDFTAFFKKDSLTVGLTSYGDTFDIVDTALSEMKQNRCDIGICACRSRGRTLDALGKTKKTAVHFVPKSISEDPTQYDYLNTKDSRTVMNVFKLLYTKEVL